MVLLRNWRTAALAILAASLAGCSRCGGGAAASKEDLAKLLPGTAEVIVIIPDVARIGEHLSQLESLKVANFFAQVRGATDAKAMVNAIAAQVGVDVRSREDLERAGFDPSRGMATVLLSGQQGYSVIACKDPRKLRAVIEKLARDRLEATTVDTTAQDGVDVTRFSGTRGVVAAMAVKDGYAFVAAEPVATRLLETIALQPGKALADDAAFQKAQGRLPKDPDLIAWLPAGSKLAEEYRAPSAAIAASFSGTDIAFTVDAPAGNVPGGLGALDAKPAKSPYALLPDDAFLVARFAGDPVTLDAVWPRIAGPRLADAIKEAGFDVRAEILANLEPGAVLSFSLSPIVRLAGGFSTDFRHNNPFKSAHLVAAAQVKDPAKLGAALEKLPAVAPKFGAEITPGDRNGQKVYVTTYSQGEGVHLALVGNDLIAASPEPRLLDAITAAKEGAKGPGPLAAPELRGALEKDAISFAVDLRKLSSSVRALPSSAWGVGGFAMKDSMLHWLTATDDLQAITGSVSQKDGAVQTQLHLRIAPK